MTTAFRETLQEKIKGLLYFSESENPYTIETIESRSLPQVTAEIAAIHNVTESQVEIGDAQGFFDHIIESADPNDPVMKTNAERTQELYDYLQSNLNDIKVFRIKSGARITVYIVGWGKDSTPVALKSLAIET